MIKSTKSLLKHHNKEMIKGAICTVSKSISCAKVVISAALYTQTK